MGIFDRLSTLLKSNINDLISSAEHPEKMLNQILVDMRTQLAKAKQQVAASIADEKRLRDQVDQEAKQALVRQNEHGSHGTQLEATWNQHRAETEKLKNSLRDLNDKIEEAKRKKNLLIARSKRAEAQARIAETMSSMSEKSAFEAFSRMETKIEDNERRMLANVEIDEEFSGDKLATDFKVLEKGAGAASADMQLLALKQKMGMLPAGSSGNNKQIGAGGSANEEIVHAEIEEPPEEQKKP